MNIKKHFITKEQHIRMLHTDPLLINKASEKILSCFPKYPCEYVTVFIGTDRATGDSLGPLTGTLFQEMNPRNIATYGTLKEPIHAKNLIDYKEFIEDKHQNPFIIAIDACLGRSSSVGHIIVNKGPLQPGAALKKDLPRIGNMSITGVVNISGFMDFSVLQNTRLSIVYDMAQQIANTLKFIDQQLLCKHPIYSTTLHPLDQKQITKT